jgi:cell division septum initiation protein DivIVA
MPADSEDVAPQFVTVMRGYDRIQVDDYVASLSTWLQETTERARLAEAAAGNDGEECCRLRDRVAELESQLADGPPRSLDQIGERVSGMLGEAGRTAEAIRQAAEMDAERISHEAAAMRSEAQQVLAEAGRERDEARRWAADARKLAEAESGELAEMLVAEARTTAAATVESAEQEAAAARQRAVDDIERLRSARDVVLHDLQRLRNALDEALGRNDVASVVDLRDARPVAANETA